VRIFGVLQDQRHYKRLSHGLTIESALDHTPSVNDDDYEKGTDVPWIRRFSKAGGRVIISGDAKMMRRPHEKKALLDEGMIAIFLVGGWDNWGFFQKSAFVLNWWPVIADTVRRAKPSYVLACPREVGTSKEVNPSFNGRLAS
jgi:PIN like domain